MITREAAVVLDDPAVTRIAVEYQDRLAHFGAEHREAALSLSLQHRCAEPQRRCKTISCGT